MSRLCEPGGDAGGSVGCRQTRGQGRTGWGRSCPPSGHEAVRCETVRGAGSGKGSVRRGAPTAAVCGRHSLPGSGLAPRASWGECRRDLGYGLPPGAHSASAGAGDFSRGPGLLVPRGRERAVLSAPVAAEVGSGLTAGDVGAALQQGLAGFSGRGGLPGRGFPLSVPPARAWRWLRGGPAPQGR